MNPQKIQTNTFFLKTKNLQFHFNKFPKCSFVNDVRLTNQEKSKEKCKRYGKSERGAEPRVEAAIAAVGHAGVFSSSVCFWLGDFQSRTAMGILLERRR